MEAAATMNTNGEQSSLSSSPTTESEMQGNSSMVGSLDGIAQVKMQESGIAITKPAYSEFDEDYNSFVDYLYADPRTERYD